MATRRDRKHIIVTTAPSAVPYRPHGRKIDPPEVPVPNRRTHGAGLRASLKLVESAAIQRRAQAQAAGLPNLASTPGVYVQFESAPNVDLKVESLEDKRSGTEVVAFTEEIRTVEQRVVRIQQATVFVPDGAVKNFIKKFESYEATPPPGTPPPAPGTKTVQRHHDTFDRVASVRAATVRALWTDEAARFPADDAPVWWEVWLRRVQPADGGGDGERAEVSSFRAYSEAVGIVVGARALGFDDRSVVLAHGSRAAFAASLDVLDALAELRSARTLAVGIEKLTNVEQREYVDDLLRRVVRQQGQRPAVCVLDRGVNRGHPLLQTDLAQADMHAVNPTWGTADDTGHGTEMAGLALFGDLHPHVLARGPVDVVHCLESVKILPPTGSNNPDLYGTITAEAVNRPEVQAPTRKRVFSMAITASASDRGKPTSWSAAIDALAAGRSFDQTTSGLAYLDGVTAPRLIVVSAGNVEDPPLDHLGRSDVDTIEDPAQAWNALTVGAHTDLARISSRPNAKALAPPGELSPWSRTSLTFEKKWPVKPDVVFEGGNLMVNGGIVDPEPLPELNVLTTSREIQTRMFELSWATSAATAQVARLAARISAAYPTLRSETIRALVVHSAEWTPRMLEAVPKIRGRRAGVRHLVRRYGFGVPNEERALRSGRDALTLVHEGIIRPFLDGKLREMHVHDLPWPRDVLMGLGDADVLLRVTLSYFVEPNPSRRGRSSRYQYASHALRFELKKATETIDEFRKRINKKDLDEGEARSDTSGDMDEWYVGEQRDAGSLHSDIWVGSAVALAERGVIAVRPVGGWWKALKHRDRSELGAQYSLVVSIETDAVEVDLWTAVAQQVGIET